jgi:3-hydroxybutyryl-CoA dehydrogenase
MGHGIALACLRDPSVEVVVISRRQESLNHGLGLLRTGPFGLEKAIARGKVSEDQASSMLDRVSGTLDYEVGLAGADLIFETVPEVLELKRDVLNLVERHSPADAVVATNTSAIQISELGQQLERPDRLVGTHWFYPSNVMALVEVTRAPSSRTEALSMVIEFLQSIGKNPVSVEDSPGFFMTRFINLYIAEAIYLVELGVAGMAEIDEMVKTGLGWPMGIFELLDDTASFDSWYHAQEYLWERCGDRYAIPPLARKAFAAGYRGNPALKPGSKGGWYEYMEAQRAVSET